MPVPSCFRRRRKDVSSSIRSTFFTPKDPPPAVKQKRLETIQTARSHVVEHSARSSAHSTGRVGAGTSSGSRQPGPQIPAIPEETSSVTESDQPSYLVDVLPSEILGRICAKYLEVEDVLTLEQTCRPIYYIVRNDENGFIWRNQFADYGCSPSLKKCIFEQSLSTRFCCIILANMLMNLDKSMKTLDWRGIVDIELAWRHYGIKPKDKTTENKRTSATSSPSSAAPNANRSPTTSGISISTRRRTLARKVSNGTGCSESRRERLRVFRRLLSSPRARRHNVPLVNHQTVRWLLELTAGSALCANAPSPRKNRGGCVNVLAAIDPAGANDDFDSEGCSPLLRRGSMRLVCTLIQLRLFTEWGPWSRLMLMNSLRLAYKVNEMLFSDHRNGDVESIMLGTVSLLSLEQVPSPEKIGQIVGDSSQQGRFATCLDSIDTAPPRLRKMAIAEHTEVCVPDRIRMPPLMHDLNPHVNCYTGQYHGNPSCVFTKLSSVHRLVFPFANAFF